MKNKHFISFCLLAALGTWLSGCHRASSVTRQNFATQYHSEEKILHPEYVLYNVTDSLTRLFFSVNSTDLLYAKNTGDAGYTARILLYYTVHPVDYAKVVVDSGHVVMSDVGTPGQNKQLAASVDMDVIGDGKYYVEVTFRDLNKMVISYELLYLDHQGKNAKNNFLLTPAESPTPLFKTYIDSGEVFNVHYNDPKVNRLFVRYYKNKFGPAPPPYAPDRRYNPPVPDSTWWMNVSPMPALKFPAEGYYTFSADSFPGDGIAVSRFHDEFPKINLARQLVYPLRYLTMREEYVEMDTSRNPKKAVDKFWLNNTGSEERAREVIRNFYNRVEATNTLFSTQMEGWKTDRGMIYLIFGPPDNVYRNASSETWIYGNSAGPGGLTFVFEHKDNASGQEFVLARNPDYKINWITAVDSWRQGHVYTLR